jgi:hypothetical protein
VGAWAGAVTGADRVWVTGEDGGGSGGRMVDGGAIGAGTGAELGWDGRLLRGLGWGEGGQLAGFLCWDGESCKSFATFMVSDEVEAWESKGRLIPFVAKSRSHLFSHVYY